MKAATFGNSDLEAVLDGCHISCGDRCLPSPHCMREARTQEPRPNQATIVSVSWYIVPPRTSSMIICQRMWQGCPSAEDVLHAVYFASLGPDNQLHGINPPPISCSLILLVPFYPICLAMTKSVLSPPHQPAVVGNANSALGMLSTTSPVASCH